VEVWQTSNLRRLRLGKEKKKKKKLKSENIYGLPYSIGRSYGNMNAKVTISLTIYDYCWTKIDEND